MAGDSLTLTRTPAPLAVSRAPEQPEHPEQPEWLRYLSAVRRYGWLVLAVTLAVTGLGVVAAMLMPPSYAAQAIVWIRVPNKEVRNEGPIWQGQLPISSGWMELLQSYAVLDYAVRTRRLYLHAAVPGDSDVLGTLAITDHVVPGEYRLVVDDSGSQFTLFAGSARDPVARGHVGDAVGSDLGLAWVPPAAALTRGRAVKFTLDAPYDAALKLADQLKVSADLDGNFLRMQLGGHDPAGVAATVNAVAERFVSVAADLKRDNLGQLTGILAAQLDSGRAALRRAEAALRAFRVGAVTTLAEGAGTVTQNTQYQRDPLFAGLVEMKVSLDELRRDRDAIERLLRQGLDSGVSVDALAMVGAVQRSTELVQALRDLTAKQAELRALRGHYTDDNPPVRRAAAEADALARRTIPALASSLAAELRVRETELSQRVATASSGLKQVPPLAVEEARLQRDVTLAEQAVTNLQQRYEEARLAEVSSIPDVRLLDRAIAPNRPVGHMGAILIVLAMMGGLGVGVTGAVVLDSTDRRVRHPDDVTRAMGLTILGTVPHVDWRNGKREAAVAQVVEALRGVRLNVVHRHGSAGPVRLTITSPGKSDGKSFVASNLALAFADTGLRTLLVDGDVRRGRLHRTLGAARRPGLTDLLEGTVTWDRAVQTTPYKNLSFISCGFRSQAGPALLSSVTMARLLDGVRASYDAVVVDSPPLAAGADGLALATVTGSLVLVLRAGVSDRELTETKLGVLTHLPVRVLGAVLNDVRPGGAYRYYSYYLEGYEAHDETNAGETRVLRGAAEEPAPR
jgi:capsular exopolysaccharide synthesis family protein